MCLPQVLVVVREQDEGGGGGARGRGMALRKCGPHGPTSLAFRRHRVLATFTCLI